MRSAGSVLSVADMFVMSSRRSPRGALIAESLLRSGCMTVRNTISADNAAESGLTGANFRKQQIRLLYIVTKSRKVRSSAGLRQNKWNISPASDAVTL